MATRSRPRFAVLYDLGAVPAGEIGAGLADLGDVAFLVPAHSDHVEQLRPVMEMLGEVHTLSGVPAADADLIRTIAPDAVLTFCDELIRPAAALAAAAGVPGPSERTARLFTDKRLQRRALAESGVDRTRTALINSITGWDRALDAVGLPAIVKPVEGTLSRHTFAIRSPADRAEVREYLGRLVAAGQWGPFIVEEFLRGRPSEPFGDYVSVESVCTPEGITHLVLTDKTPVMPPFRGTGRIWPSHLPEAEQREVLDLVGAALRAVGANCGFTHTEVKLTADGPRIIEINGRISGYVNMMARETCDVDLVELGARVALGESRLPAPFDLGGKVYFQYNNLAPQRPCRLEGVEGAEEVRSLPGVTAYRSFVRPGTDLSGGTATRTLDTVSGVGEDHDAVLACIEAARAALTFELCFEDGPRRLTGLELPQY
ncbi:ATP-grasp domain-containing protein [Kitasatospora sp. NPDC057542]|uniref:ATP-grasp domain-containing protein n=1 Tax=Kitasatospora sp. NPDC057542 TaxID=3346162 RepID=UPI0036861334